MHKNIQRGTLTKWYHRVADRKVVPGTDKQNQSLPVTSGHASQVFNFFDERYMQSDPFIQKKLTSHAAKLRHRGAAFSRVWFENVSMEGHGMNVHSKIRQQRDK